MQAIQLLINDKAIIRRMLLLIGMIIPMSSHAVTTILSDDFGAGSVGETFRIYENRIDTGWNKGPFSYAGQPASAWTISGGVASNASSLAAAGYPNSKEAEAPLYNFFSGAGTVERKLVLSFDYSVGAGDQLYVHLWGVTGAAATPGDFVSNIEASANGNVNLNAGTGDTTTLTTYNLAVRGDIQNSAMRSVFRVSVSPALIPRPILTITSFSLLRTKMVTRGLPQLIISV